jgi:hypothetical protein
MEAIPKMLHTVLLVAALLLFVGAGVGVSHPRLNLVALGLACWIATLVF